MIVGTRNKTNHKSNQHRLAKQARSKDFIRKIISISMIII